MIFFQERLLIRLLIVEYSLMVFLINARLWELDTSISQNRKSLQKKT